MSKTRFERMIQEEKALRRKANRGGRVKESELSRLRGRLDKLARRGLQDEYGMEVDTCHTA